MSIPPVGLLHPALSEAALRVALAREGELRASGNEIYSVTEHGLTLSLRLAPEPGKWTVLEARHRGASEPALRGVVDTFCQAIEGLPLREAADHGAIHALEKLRGDPLARPVPGILTTHSAGTAFITCETLIRSIYHRLEARHGAEDRPNFWNPPLSEAWRAKSDAARIATLEPAIDRFRREHDLRPADLWVERIEKTRRVVIGFGPEVGYTAKPALLMRLEVDIRNAMGERLELFMAEAKDSNAIRRLTPEEEAR